MEHEDVPEFELPDADMNMVRSSEFAGRNYVLYFYPKDDTPGCTTEALDFTAPAYRKGDFTSVSLSDYAGKWVLLCFYPGDFTFV